MREHKSLPITELKTSVASEGTFEALVAVFGNVDNVGDRIHKGAFEETLKERGLPPIYHSHLWTQGPIGETSSAVETDEGLEIKGTLYVDDPMVNRIYRAMQAKQLKEFSFAYEVKSADETTENDKTIRELRAVDLYEVGPTLLGANPQTGLLEIPKALVEDDVEQKSVIPFKETAKLDESTAWNAAAEVARADTADLRAMCAWYDSSAADAKSSYKLPHHRSDGSHPVVWRGVAAAMGALLGARGGVAIPDGDKRGVYSHLSKHYAQFEKQPPELRSYDDAELKALFASPEPPDPAQAVDLVIGFSAQR